MHRAPHSMSGSSISTRSCAGNRVLLRIFTEIAKSSTFHLQAVACTKPHVASLATGSFKG